MYYLAIQNGSAAIGSNTMIARGQPTDRSGVEVEAVHVWPYAVGRTKAGSDKEAQVRTLTKVCWGLAIGWIGVGIAAFVYAWLSKRRFGLFDKSKPHGKP